MRKGEGLASCLNTMISCASCVDAAAAIGGLVMATAMASEGMATTAAHVGHRNKTPGSGMPQGGQGFTLALPQHRAGILQNRPGL